MADDFVLEPEAEKEIIDSELKKFNWGAAVFCFIWGLFNGAFLRCIATYMVALVLVGVVLLTVPDKIYAVVVFALFLFYLGVKGSSWAWEQKKWKDVRHFVVVQNRWNMAALVVFGIFFIVPMLSFMVIYLISGEAIFKSISAMRLPDKDDPFVELFLTDVNVTSAANEDVIIDYLIKDKSDVSENKYTRYNKNTVKVDSSLFSPKQDDTETLYTFKKEAICKLKKKNCYIIRYKYEENKVFPVAKMYFDSVGKYKTVKLLSKQQ